MNLYRMVFIALLCAACTFASAQSPERRFEKGMRYFRGMEYDSAIAIFSDVIARYPAFDDAYYYRGTSKEQLDDLNGAYLDYKYVVSRRPNDAEALLTLAMTSFKLKYFDESRDIFRDLLRLPGGPTNRFFYEMDEGGHGVTGVFTAQGNIQGMYYYYLGRIGYAEGDYVQAGRYYDSALMHSPDKVNYWIDRGEAFGQLGNTTAYEQSLRKALALEPGNERANYLMGRLMEGADPEKAVDYYSESISVTPDNPAPYRQRGFNRMKSGDLKGAEADFSRAISLDPREPTSYINRGIVREKLHKYESAVNDYSQAIDLAPSEVKAYLNRGNALYKLREYENALNDYTVALFYEPGYVTALYQRGLTYYQLGNRPAACADLDKARSANLKYVDRAYAKICNIN